MMGKFSALIASIIFSTAPLTSNETTSIQIEETLGRDTVSSVRRAYELGMYDDFLKSMDEAYKGADLSGLKKLRERDVPIDLQLSFEEKFTELQKKKNSEMLAAISDFDGSIFADKVRSTASTVSTPEQEKALSRLNSLISMAPGTGANLDENELIDIDLEFEYKLFHAKLPLEDVSPQEIANHQIVLRMAKMDKMVEASKKFQDLQLKNAVSLTTNNFDARLARNLDGSDLNAMVRQKAKPSNASEEKVFSVISAYQAQFDDLMKNLSDG